MPVVACERCGVKLSETSMKFHRQVCGSTQKPQCNHCGRRFDADALAVHEAVCGDRGPAPAARNASPKSVVRPDASTPPPHNNSSGAGAAPVAHPEVGMARAAVKKDNTGMPTTAQDSAADSHAQRRRDEMRRNLAQLREEVYGRARDNTGGSTGDARERSTDAVGGRASIVSTSSADDDFVVRGRREGSNPRSGQQERRQRRAPSPNDEAIDVRSSRSGRGGERDGRGSDTGYYAEPSGAEQSPPQSDMGSFDATRRSAAAKYAVTASAAPATPPPSVASSTEVSQLHRAFNDLKAASHDQSKRIDRLDDIVQSIRRDMDEVLRVQHRTKDDIDALRSRGAVAPKEHHSGAVIAAEEMRTDLHNLGRHVDVLRDELDGVRAETARQRRDMEERIAALTRTSSEQGRRFKDVEADLEEIRGRLATAHEAAGDGGSSAAVAEMQHALEALGQQVAGLVEEADRQHKERESQQLLRRDVKYIGRDIDAMQDELKYLRRQVDNERRRVDQAVSNSMGNSTPRRVVNQHTSPLPPRDTSPQPVEYEQHRVPGAPRDLRGAAPPPPASRRDPMEGFDAMETYVVGNPAMGAGPRSSRDTYSHHSGHDNETETMVVRAMSTNRPRGSVVSAPAYRGYSSSRGSSVSSTGQPPVTQLHLTTTGGRRM